MKRGGPSNVMGAPYCHGETEDMELGSPWVAETMDDTAGATLNQQAPSYRDTLQRNKPNLSFNTRDNPIWVDADYGDLTEDNEPSENEDPTCPTILLTVAEKYVTRSMAQCPHHQDAFAEIDLNVNTEDGVKEDTLRDLGNKHYLNETNMTLKRNPQQDLSDGEARCHGIEFQIDKENIPEAIPEGQPQVMAQRNVAQRTHPLENKSIRITPHDRASIARPITPPCSCVSDSPACYSGARDTGPTGLNANRNGPPNSGSNPPDKNPIIGHLGMGDTPSTGQARGRLGQPLNGISLDRSEEGQETIGLRLLRLSTDDPQSWALCVGSSEFMNVLKEHIRVQQPTILALVETHITGSRAQSVCDRIGLGGCFRVEAQGFHDGIWILWRPDEDQSSLGREGETGTQRKKLAWTGHYHGRPTTLLQGCSKHAELRVNLRTLATELTHWNKEVFGNLFRRKRNLWTRIEGIQCTLNNGGPRHLAKLEVRLRKELDSKLDQIESLWQQKS
ncbi:hypothetical protein Cgig2_009394 [Carnegiea gigantea]|uniref:Uncharacterized protein n=1 Tax=Carnegiea gigantea TaxID=171969 RepID=A0A9Q1GJF0_9CARY|nr:hypothetical protein Cgig2_009394 [Carnegiea gigantea]